MLSIAVQSFVGVIFWVLSNPVIWVAPQGLSNCYPPFSLRSMSLCSGCQFCFLGKFLCFVVFNGGYEATPLWAVRVPLLVGRSILHQRGRQALSFLLTWGVLTCFTPPFLFGLANHDPVQWVVTFNMGFTICQCQWALTSFPLPYIHVPSKTCSHVTLPVVFTHLLWMLQ